MDVASGSKREEFLGRVRTRQTLVGVIGLGYVGLPLALLFEEAGFPVIGFNALASGRAPVIYGDGQQSRDFTLVDDVVLANLLAATAAPTATGRAYNIAQGGQTTVNQLAAGLLDVCGGGPAPVHVEPRPGDILHSQADCAQAAEVLGFRTRTTLLESLRRSKDYFEGVEGRSGRVERERP